MFSIFGKYRNIVIGIIIVIVVVLIIYFWGKRNGKKYTPKDVTLPADTQGTGVPLNWNPATITDDIHEDLDEIVGVHSAIPYENAITLSNSQLVAVWNDWNHRYFNDFGNKNIVQAIKSETSLWNYDWALATKALVERYASLGLK